ncbi:MAG: DUF87 domain-containing protein [Clostridiales bacterium]|jgi:DNA helicase HerA-like ATPase|nr:DUF87 domain-containing protein [Clostridiales bacterium]
MGVPMPAGGNGLTTNPDEIIMAGIEMANQFASRNYLSDLSKLKPVELDQKRKSFLGISLFLITKIVLNEEENINDKLTSVYAAMGGAGSTVLLVIAGQATGIEFYIGARSDADPELASHTLEKSLRGNFPGIQLDKVKAGEVRCLMTKLLPEKYEKKSVAAVSVIPGTRDEDKQRFVQGLEKFIDALAGDSYTAVLVAEPLGRDALDVRKRGYEQMYTLLSQFSEINFAYSENNSRAVSEGISRSLTASINDSVADTITTNVSTSDSRNRSHNSGSSMNFFGLGHNSGSSRGTSKTTTSGESAGKTATYGTGRSDTKGANSSSTDTLGTTINLTTTRQNKTVQALMEMIDEQIKRIRQCESYGFWDVASYFIAGESETALVAANTFKAIVAGEQSAIESSFVNLWDADDDERDVALDLFIIERLRYGVHPQFILPPPAGVAGDNKIISPASAVSGAELPIIFGLPRKSVSGLTAIFSAEFGRNIAAHRGARSFEIGSVYHMGEAKGIRVPIDIDSLAAHCLITGSTGCGKSNATYKILEELRKKGITFMVIEPAKGEYKTAFGGLPGIHIYTTNPKYFNMLRLNPFALNPEIHVLEHLDRLIEIFSACWPLYAAMPALLKASFEEAYRLHGWDLNLSVRHEKGIGEFPTFADILEILPKLLEESEFSAQTKGDYTGSLVTRVRSLTNGIVGQIFGADAIDDNALFNANVVIDLSRVGSIETKALIMGILVLKLSEFRQSEMLGHDLPLRHVTILEEAHNLLKRCCTDQGQESANVQGKSVEMISSSIAEMRTYGEGFLIIDQSPSAVDISAIKNTNTKIVMRTPETDDCEAIGRSIGLNEMQIAELSRLPRGVAAIYQNNWLEAVLSLIDCYEKKHSLKSLPVNSRQPALNLIGDLTLEFIKKKRLKLKIDFKLLDDKIKLSPATESEKSVAKRLIREYKPFEPNNGPERARAYYRLLFLLLNCEDLFRTHANLLPPGVKNAADITQESVDICLSWRRHFNNALEEYLSLGKFTSDEINYLMHCLILHKIETEKKPDPYRVLRKVLLKEKT